MHLMEDQTGRRLDRLESAFETSRIEVNARFDLIDERFLRIEARLDGIDRRLDGIDRRLDRMDDRFDRMDGRLDSMQRTMTQGFIALTVGMLSGFTALGGLIVALA
jgi:hypothetical protein